MKSLSDKAVVEHLPNTPAGWCSRPLGAVLGEGCLERPGTMQVLQAAPKLKAMKFVQEEEWCVLSMNAGVPLELSASNKDKAQHLFRTCRPHSGSTSLPSQCHHAFRVGMGVTMAGLLRRLLPLLYLPLCMSVLKLWGDPKASPSDVARAAFASDLISTLQCLPPFAFTEVVFTSSFSFF